MDEIFNDLVENLLTVVSKSSYPRCMKTKSRTKPTGLECLKKWQGDRTDAEMAEIIGISRSYYSDIRRGRCRPGWKLSLQIQTASGGRVPLPSWVPALPPAEPPAVPQEAA